MNDNIITLYEAMKYIDDYLDYVYEMKTRDEYSREKFKKKYDFKSDGSDKYNNTGTIMVNGENIPVNMGKSKYVDFEGNDVSRSGKADSINADRRTKKSRSTSVSYGDDNKVILDNKFFKLKNQKRKDAVLHHELTHRSKQLPPADKRYQTDSVRKLFDKRIKDKLIEDGESEDVIKRNDNRVTKYFVDGPILHNKQYNTKNINRDKALKQLASKYNYYKGSSSDALEKEADIGGAKAVSKKDMSKALSELDKMTKNDDKKKLTKDELSKNNTNRGDILKSRIHSLKDKDNSNIKFYKDEEK